MNRFVIKALSARKTLSILLALVMWLSLLPAAPAFAEAAGPVALTETPAYATGEGEIQTVSTTAAEPPFAPEPPPDTPADYVGVLDKTLAYIAENTTGPIVGSVGGEWAVVALARGGRMTDGIKTAYLKNLDTALAGQPKGATKLHEFKATENQRVILALTALGLDAADYKGYDLVSPLVSDTEWTNWQGVNSTAFALIALDSKPYAGNQAYYVSELLKLRHTDGGWSLDSTPANASSVDETAMVIQALAPHRSEPGVQAAIDGALTWLKGRQSENGGFGMGGYAGSSESTVQVLTALSALSAPGGGDIPNAETVLKGLLSYTLPDGGFKHTAAGGAGGGGAAGGTGGGAAGDGVSADSDSKDSGDGGEVTENIRERRIPAGAWENPAADILSDAWYYEDVAYVYQNGLMLGTSADAFSPDAELTRGMIVTILHRHAGTPDAGAFANPFGDVAESAWYTDAIKWAAGNGIVLGVGQNSFEPDSPVTRQDLAVILARYIEYIKFEYAVTEEYRLFADEDAIAGYAKAAVQLLNKLGIINGVGGDMIDPLGDATRAQTAAMLHRLCELTANR